MQRRTRRPPTPPHVLPLRGTNNLPGTGTNRLPHKGQRGRPNTPINSTTRTKLKGSNNIKTTDIPTGHKSLTRDQERIGWSHLWSARWSTRWADYHSDNKEPQEVNRYHRTKWIQGVTNIIRNHKHSKWVMRGKRMSGKDGSPG